MGVCAGRCRHEHVGVRDDPHARDGQEPARRGHSLHGDHEARGLDARLCRPDVLHVVGHDGGDDAAQRGADDPFVCDGLSQAERHRPSLCRDEHLRVWLSRRVGWLQLGRGNSAVGVRAHRNPSTDARRDQRDLRRLRCCSPPASTNSPRSSMPVFATADRHLRFFVPIGGGVPMARYAWVFCTALSASAAAGS